MSGQKMSEQRAMFVSTSQKAKEAALDEMMKHPRFQGLSRDEVRRIDGGLGILAKQRMREAGVDYMAMQFTDEDIELAKKLWDESPLSKLAAKLAEIRPRRRPMHDQDLEGYKARLEDCKVLTQCWRNYARRLREGTEPDLAKVPKNSRILEATCYETCASNLEWAIEGAEEPR